MKVLYEYCIAAYFLLSEGGSFALHDPVSSSHNIADDWISEIGNVNGWGSQEKQSEVT